MAKKSIWRRYTPTENKARKKYYLKLVILSVAVGIFATPLAGMITFSAGIVLWIIHSLVDRSQK